MNWSIAFTCSVLAFIAISAFFSVLYFAVVIPRLRNTGHKIGFSAFVNIYQSSYVNSYIGTLSPEDRRKWYNVLLKHSFLIAGLVWVFCMGSLFLSFWLEP